MRPTPNADHTPPSSAEVKKELSYTSTQPMGPPGPVTAFPLPLIKIRVLYHASKATHLKLTSKCRRKGALQINNIIIPPTCNICPNVFFYHALITLHSPSIYLLHFPMLPLSLICFYVTAERALSETFRSITFAISLLVMNAMSSSQSFFITPSPLRASWSPRIA